MEQLLNLNEIEKSKISKICRNNKFENAGIIMLYPKDNFEKIKYFNKCYKFLNNLLNIDLSEINSMQTFREDTNDTRDIEDTKDTNGIEENLIKRTKDIHNIKQKIEKFILLIKPLYEESFFLINEYDLGNDLIKYLLSDSVFSFLRKNEDIVNYTIDKVHELGKNIKMYNPDETQGFY